MVSAACLRIFLKDSGKELLAMTEPSTSVTLIARVRALEPAAWRRLVQLYYPLVYRWCRTAGLRDEDAGDVCQEVFAGLAANLPQYQPERRFRPWLRGITRNKLRLHWQQAASAVEGRGGTGANAQLENFPQPEGSEEDPERESENALLVQKALAFIRPEFREQTWRAFWETVVESRSPADVAADLGITRNAVYVAKSRVLHRLRIELEELFD